MSTRDDTQHLPTTWKPNEPLKTKPVEPTNGYINQNGKCYRSDRLFGKEKGLTIMIKHKIDHTHEDTYKTTNLGEVTFKIRMVNNTEIQLVAIYNSPSKSFYIP